MVVKVEFFVVVLSLMCALNVLFNFSELWPYSGFAVVNGHVVKQDNCEIGLG